MAFTSFAQNFEDVMLWRALGHVPGGFYVDVGACEPEAESVTAAFYERGWRGINVEPSPAAFGRLQAARPRDINLNLAAGAADASLPFLMVAGGNGLSTLRADMRPELERGGWAVEQVEVPVRRLADLCAEHAAGPIHFLKIDAEGAERAVLEGAELEHWRPWIVVCEATVPNSPAPSFADWEPLLLGAGYSMVYADGLNRFYLSPDHPELAAAFTVPPNVFDNFVRRREVQAEADAAASRARVGEAEARAADSARTAEAAQAATQAATDAARQQEDRLRQDAAEAATAATAAAAEHETATAALSARLALMEAERDAAVQEVFESNRVAGILALDRQKLLDELRIRAAEAEQATRAELAAMRTSTSWRLTAPLRAVVRRTRRR